MNKIINDNNIKSNINQELINANVSYLKIKSMPPTQQQYEINHIQNGKNIIEIKNSQSKKFKKQVDQNIIHVQVTQKITELPQQNSLRENTFNNQEQNNEQIVVKKIQHKQNNINQQKVVQTQKQKQKQQNNQNIRWVNSSNPQYQIINKQIYMQFSKKKKKSQNISFQIQNNIYHTQRSQVDQDNQIKNLKSQMLKCQNDYLTNQKVYNINQINKQQISDQKIYEKNGSKQHNQHLQQTKNIIQRSNEEYQMNKEESISQKQYIELRLQIEKRKKTQNLELSSKLININVSSQKYKKTDKKIEHKLQENQSKVLLPKIQTKYSKNLIKPEINNQKYLYNRKQSQNLMQQNNIKNLNQQSNELLKEKDLNNIIFSQELSKSTQRRNLKFGKIVRRRLSNNKQYIQNENQPNEQLIKQQLLSSKKQLSKQKLFLQKINLNTNNFKNFVQKQNRSNFYNKPIKQQKLQKLNSTYSMKKSIIDKSQSDQINNNLNRQIFNNSEQIFKKADIQQNQKLAQLKESFKFIRNNKLKKEKIENEYNKMQTPSPENDDFTNLQNSLNKKIKQKVQKQRQLSFLFSFPKLHNIPTPNMNQQELMKMGKSTFKIFNIDLVDDTPLNIKKYKNCVYYNVFNTHILWHFTGKFYIGQWEINQLYQGQKSGNGIEFIPQKYLYQGEFKQGKRNGYGVMKLPSGDIYTGQWYNGLRQGKGNFTKANGKVYNGQWKQGKKNGYGYLFFSNEEVYEGQFLNGNKQGYGKQTFKNGDMYEGFYKQNQFSGKGTYKWVNGAYYTGQFLKGMRHGRGVWKSLIQNGDSYQGQYKNDQKFGEGKFIWKTGEIYIGAFKNDLRNGEGIIKFSNGLSIRALWEHGIVIKKLFFNENPQKKIKQSIDQSLFATKNSDIQNPVMRKKVLNGKLTRIEQQNQMLMKLISNIKDPVYNIIQRANFLTQQ